MTAYNSFEDNTLEGLLSKYGCPRRRYFYKETHPEYKAWFAGLPGEIQIKINLLRDTKKIDEKTIKEETNVVRKKIHSFSGRKRKNNFGRDVNFREKTYAFELEKYLFKNSGLNQETGCSKWVKISELPHELNFTGNGSKLRPESSFRKKYDVEYKKEGIEITQFRCSGYAKTEKFKQHIRQDIKDYYSQKPSVLSGLKSNIEIDHKNGRKNDFRLNNPNEQTLEDFQPLTKHENDFKRQKCKECEATNIRPSGKIGPFGYLGVDYTEGGNNYDECIGCSGCWLYDIIKFRDDALKIRDEALKRQNENNN